MSDTVLTPQKEEIIQSKINEVFSLQKQKAIQIAQTGVKERRQKLKKILEYIQENEASILKAMYDDFRKPPTEALISEVMVISNEIKHYIKKLKSWMQPKRVSTPLTHIGYIPYVKSEPKGTTLIISPWNYPFVLALKPLVAAIAAGNTAIMKPSEMTPHVSGFISKMISDLFPKDEITVFEGDYKVAGALLELPFNHIFFTGSPTVGKIVMNAASKHLTSVTLELGGKSPTIVDETADIKDVAAKIAWGKCLNNGQTCIAPDYLFVQKSVKEPLLYEINCAINKMLDPENKGIENSEDYARIVNSRHYNRIKELLEDAKEKGAQIYNGGNTIDEENYIAPTIVCKVNDNMKLLQEEIFGPVLPVLEFECKDEVVNYINRKEKPLALYVFSKKKENINYFLNHTSSGNAVVNDLVLHVGHTSLPFGGVNNSGIGKSGGHYSFEEFSNQKGILKQKFGTIKFLYPPYNDTVKKITRLIMKYF